MLIFEVLCIYFKQQEIEKAKQQLDKKVMIKYLYVSYTYICIIV